MSYCYECGCEHGYHLPRCSSRINGTLVNRCIPLSTEEFRKLVEKAATDPESESDVVGASIGILLGFCNELVDRVNELQDLAHKHEDA